MNKEDARKLGRNLRSSLSNGERAFEEEAVLSQLKEICRDVEVIGCYVSVKDELDTMRFIAWCLEEKKTVAVPKVEGGTLGFYRIESFEDLVPAPFSILEPKNGAGKINLSSIGMMIVPALAIDCEGNRVGYGRGYYDSVLSAGMDAVGIIFRGQLVDRIDADPWDVKLSRVITG